jgi:hypothetical protein
MDGAGRQILTISSFGMMKDITIEPYPEPSTT